VRHMRKISACRSVVQIACFRNFYQSLQVYDSVLLENSPRLHRVVFRSVFTLFHSRSLERACYKLAVVFEQVHCGVHSGSDRPLQPEGLGKGPTFCHGLRLHVPAL
jgi:hypothetical protein